MNKYSIVHNSVNNMTVTEPDFELTIGEHISRSLRPSNAPEKSRYVAYADGKKDRRVILIEDPEDVFGDGINHSGDIALLEIAGRYPAYYKAVNNEGDAGG